jgi:hypothetical protein
MRSCPPPEADMALGIDSPKWRSHGLRTKRHPKVASLRRRRLPYPLGRFFSYRYINPTSREERAILANLSRYEIVSITVEPARSGYPSVISNSIAIRDKPGIGQFSNALSKIFLREPEHPRVTRAAILRIQLKDKTLGGYLEESSNDGTTFYCMSDITSGWVFGAYSVPGGRALFDAIQRLASAASKDTQPVVR